MKPLRQGEDPVGRLLEAASQYAPDDAHAKARVWHQLSAGARPPNSMRHLSFAAAIGACVLAVAVAVAVVGVASRGPSEIPLEGVVHLEGVLLSPAPDVVAERVGHEIRLHGGALDIEASRPVAVMVGGDRVEAEHATLRVSVAADGTMAVLVHEGAVVLRRGSTAQIHSLSSGQQWTTPGVVPAERLHLEALRLEREGQGSRALLVLDRLKAQPGVWGELALYDEARIALKLEENSRAAVLIEEHGRRFPRGRLVEEVAGLRLQLVP